jgi:hypothetical protein
MTTNDPGPYRAVIDLLAAVIEEAREACALACPAQAEEATR